MILWEVFGYCLMRLIIYAYLMHVFLMESTAGEAPHCKHFIKLEEHQQKKQKRN